MNWDDAEEEVEVEIKVPPPDPKRQMEIAAIRSSQEAFDRTVSDLIALYRGFDKTLRTNLKVKLKGIYERLKTLGSTIGIAPISMDKLWED